MAGADTRDEGATAVCRGLARSYSYAVGRVAASSRKAYEGNWRMWVGEGEEPVDVTSRKRGTA